MTKTFICITLAALFFLGCSNDDSGDGGTMEDNTVTIEFSQQSGADLEMNSGNLPVLLLAGTVSEPSTVTISDTGTGSATGGGVDYSFESPQTITIPTGSYSGSLATAIAIPTLSIVDDNDIEGTETIVLALSDPTGEAILGNTNTTNYQILDDEAALVQFSQATFFDQERNGGNLPFLLVTGIVSEPSTVTISDTGTGSATGGGVDYSFESPQTITVPIGTYDGTSNSAIAIPGLTIVDDAMTEGIETIALNLSEATGNAILESETTTTYEIRDVIPCENGMVNNFSCNGYDLLGQVSLSTFSASSGNDIWGWTDPTTAKEYALVGLDDGTAFVDVSDDENLVYLGKLPTATVSSTWRDIKVYQNHAFIVSEAAGHGMQVFDLTRLRSVIDPPETFSADTRYTNIGNAHNIVINEEIGYAYPVGTQRNDAFNGGVHFVNIQNPTNPVGVGGYGNNGYTHDAQVVTYNGPDMDYAGREILVGANETQIAIVDITSKTNPTEVATLSYGNLGYTHQGWFTDDHRYYILGDELDEINFGFNSRTLVFDLSDLENPIIHTTYTGPTSAIDHNGYVLGNEFFLSNYTAGIRVLDISAISSGTITEKGHFDTYPSNDTPSFDGVWSVYPYFDSGKIIVNDINSGLFVIRESD
ncbi:MAG: choice-of-anchor B family protein [Bacteroidota bacterium]